MPVRLGLSVSHRNGLFNLPSLPFPQSVVLLQRRGRVPLSVFKDKAGADESVRLAAEYVKQRLSKLFTQKPEIIEGPIKAHD